MYLQKNRPATREFSRVEVTAWRRRVSDHSRRVAASAHRLACAIGLSSKVVEQVSTAGLLHDIGKVRLPQKVLCKPAKLSAREWDIVRRHPSVGAEIAMSFGLDKDLCAMIRHHHEHWDGSGYPDGLAGTDITIGARILCVVDVFDALTSQRPYRPAMSAESALSCMHDEAGSTFDTQLFNVFARLT